MVVVREDVLGFAALVELHADDGVVLAFNFAATGVRAGTALCDVDVVDRGLPALLHTTGLRLERAGAPGHQVGALLADHDDRRPVPLRDDLAAAHALGPLVPDVVRGVVHADGLFLGDGHPVDDRPVDEPSLGVLPLLDPRPQPPLGGVAASHVDHPDDAVDAPHQQGDQHVQGDGLAGALLAADEDAVLAQQDLERLAALQHAQCQGLVDGDGVVARLEGDQLRQHVAGGHLQERLGGHVAALEGQRALTQVALAHLQPGQQRQQGVVVEFGQPEDQPVAVAGLLLLHYLHAPAADRREQCLPVVQRLVEFRFLSRPLRGDLRRAQPPVEAVQGGCNDRRGGESGRGGERPRGAIGYPVEPGGGAGAPRRGEQGVVPAGGLAAHHAVGQVAGADEPAGGGGDHAADRAEHQHVQRHVVSQVLDDPRPQTSEVDEPGGESGRGEDAVLPGNGQFVVLVLGVLACHGGQNSFGREGGDSGRRGATRGCGRSPTSRYGGRDSRCCRFAVRGWSGTSGAPAALRCRCTGTAGRHRGRPGKRPRGP